MKKVLFATSALVASASMAYADVSLSGSGRFGIVYNQAFSGVAGRSTTKIEKRMTINIDGSGSTDSGLEFGGRIRLRSDEVTGTAASAANVFMGNDTWRITVGNTDGALLNRIGYYQGTVGLTGLHWANVSFNIGTSTFDLNSFSSRGGNNADVVRLDFNTGGFGVSLSTSSTGDHIDAGFSVASVAGSSTQNAVAASYNFGDWTVAAGFANIETVNAGATAVVQYDVVSASIVGSLGDFGVGLGYTDKENIGNKVTLSGSYSFGDTSVTAFVASTSEDTAGSAGFVAGVSDEESEYGIGFTHSLGGATLAGGLSSNFTGNSMADLGVSFSF